MGATESTEAGAQQQQDKPAVVPSALVLCGPSGVGKGTVISRLMHDEEHFGFSCSHTTRKPRAGEEVSPTVGFKAHQLGGRVLAPPRQMHPHPDDSEC